MASRSSDEGIRSSDEGIEERKKEKKKFPFNIKKLIPKKEKKDEDQLLWLNK